MAGTNRANGQDGTYKVTNQSSAFIKAPVSEGSTIKPQVAKGGDLRAKGSK